MARIVFLGDVMLGRGVAEEVPRRTPESFWGDTLPLLRNADLVVANLECAITRHPFPWARHPKVFHFKAPPEAVEVLRAAGIRLVSLANNHILDFEEEGLLETLEHLDRAGIARAGAGRSADEARSPAIVDVAGMRIGMLAATDNEPRWAAGPASPGTFYLDLNGDLEPALSAVAEGVRQAREQGAEFLILSLHWGPNMVQRPPQQFREFARAALDRGIDLIYGHSAHLFHGVELYRDKLVLYDTGDLLDDYAVDPALRNDLSLLFFVELDARGVRELQMAPVRLEYARVRRARGRDLEEIQRRMRSLSAELGSLLEEADGWLRLELPRAETAPAASERAPRVDPRVEGNRTGNSN